MENINTQNKLISIKKEAVIGWVICTLGAIFYCYEYLLRIQPSVMVPELMRQFHMSADRFGAIISLYYLAYTPMQAVVGVITDLYGPRYILTFAVTVCTLGSLLFGIADNLYLAGIGRFMIGFGSAFAFVSALKLASIWLPLNRFALFAGLVTALGMIGGMVGDIGLTSLVNTMGWKQTIYASTIVGAILTPIIWLIIKDRNQRDPRNARIAYHETFKGLLNILANAQAWIAGIIGCILYMSLSVFAELWGIPFLKTVYHLNSNQAAFAVSMVFLGWLIGAPLTGWISDRIRRRKIPLLIGCLLSGITIAFIIFMPDLSLFTVQILLFLFGVFSSIEVVCFAVGRETSPVHMAGAAVSFVNFLVMLGGLAFQPIVGRILDSHWSGGLSEGIRQYSTANYQIALLVIPISLIIGVVFSLLLKESFQGDSQRDE